MSEPLSASFLANFIDDWSPEPLTTVDVISAGRVGEVAATLNLHARFVDDDPLPPLWQWAFFLDWPLTAELGADGHPRHGHFLPPIPNRRRMFAGGRLAVTEPLTIGRPASKHSEIVGATVKKGRTGALLFVTVRHSYRQGETLSLVEEEDVVYRSDDGTSTAFTRSTADLGPQTTSWSTAPEPDPTLLFRFSALTANAHRIHYDEAYTTSTEGYPGLVVHGPLLAVYMAELVREKASGHLLRKFEFRLQRPVFIGDPIRVQGNPDASSVDLSVVSGMDTVHATARAVLS